MHPRSKTAIVSTSSCRPTLSYLFVKNKVYKTQSVFPELLIPTELNFEGTKHLLAPKRVVLESFNGQGRKRTKKARHVRRHRTFNKKHTNVGETVNGVSSAKNVRDSDPITTVVPFQLGSATSSANTAKDTVKTDEDLLSQNL